MNVHSPALIGFFRLRSEAALITPDAFGTFLSCHLDAALLAGQLTARP